MESSRAPFSFRHKCKEFKKYMTYGNKKSLTLTTLSVSIVTVILLSYMNTNNPNYVYAHSLPVTETPASNSIIKKGAPLPSKITIDFSERPDPNVKYYTSIKLEE